LVIGSTISHYRIVEKLGEGGMGAVYEGRHTTIGNRVAIKTLHPDSVSRPEALERFRREAQAAANLSHPNIVNVYDWGKYEGTYFIAMEYVDGEDLAALQRRIGRLSPEAARDFGRQLALGLGAAHARGVVHRDLKPANVMIDARGRVRITDFGLAVRPGPDGARPSAAGTPAYMSPEQLRGEEPDARADVYACGVVLYEMFTGASPFRGTSYAELVAQTVHEAPPPLSEPWPEVPPELERIVLRCLAKDPAERYPSAAALYADLGRLKA